MTTVAGGPGPHRTDRHRYADRPVTADHACSTLADTLEAAEDPTTPTLHRLRLLADLAADLDDLVSGRSAPPRRPGRCDHDIPLPAGAAPAPVRQLAARHATCFTDQVRPALAAEGISILGWPDLDETDRSQLHGYFQRQLLPILVPLAVDAAHPFPRIIDRCLNLAVVVADPDGDTMRFAQVAVPDRLPRFVPLPGDNHHGIRTIAVEDVIAAHLDQLFRDVPVLEHHRFRITRRQPITPDSRGPGPAPDTAATRPAGHGGTPVRLEVSAPIADWVLSLLLHHLHLDDRKAWRLPGPLGLSTLAQIHDLATSGAAGHRRPTDRRAGAHTTVLRRGDRHTMVRTAAHPGTPPGERMRSAL
jgi:polyphosphate kinase